MKSNQEILDRFGQLLVESVFDNQYRFIKNNIETLTKTEGYQSLFDQMTEKQKTELEFYTREILAGALFDFLKIFEEHPEFKIIYTETSRTIDLNEASEMLKAEAIIEDGWIRRFSKYHADFNAFKV